MPDKNIAVTYDALYACDVADIERRAVERYKQQMHYDRIFREKERKMMRKEQEERRRYFLNQKLIGFFFLAVAVVLALLVDMVCIVRVIPAVSIIASKKMLVVNDYWKTHGGADQWSEYK